MVILNARLTAQEDCPSLMEKTIILTYNDRFHDTIPKDILISSLGKENYFHCSIIGLGKTDLIGRLSN